MSEQINNTQTQEQKRSNKPLAVINVEAVVKEEPILKKIGKGADETELFQGRGHESGPPEGPSRSLPAPQWSCGRGDIPFQLAFYPQTGTKAPCPEDKAAKAPQSSAQKRQHS